MFTRTGPCTPRPFTTATSVGVTAAPGNGAAGMSALAYGTAHTVLRAKQGQCRFGPTQCFGSAAAAWRDPHREDLPRVRSAGSRGDSHGRSAVLGCEAADPAVGIASLARRSAFQGSLVGGLERSDEGVPLGGGELVDRGVGGLLGVTDQDRAVVVGYFHAITAARRALAGLAPVQGVQCWPAFVRRSRVCVHGSASTRKASNRRAARAIRVGSVCTVPWICDSE